MSGLSGMKAMVTGGSRGIGAAISLELARQGCDVALTHVGDADHAAKVAAEITALDRIAETHESDSADPDACRTAMAAILESFGDLDILVCNAGITRDGMIWNLSDKAWNDVIGVNLNGYFHAMREASKVFKERRGGRIVTVTSINGLRGKFGQSNYTAAKGGVIALTKTVARELGKFNVNVNAVAPGMVATEMAEALAPEFRETAINETLLGRLASPEDIARVVAFLCSDAARHITGEVIKVDGGQYL